MNPCIIDMCFYMGLHQAEIKIGGSDSLINMLLQQMNVYSKRGALHNKEDDIYTQMLQLGRKALQKYVDSLEEEPAESAINAHNEALPYKKTVEKEYVSLFGPITIRRAYYWKNDCSCGTYPLDKELELPEGKFSYALQNMLLKLMVSSPYSEALDTIHRIFKVQIWPQAAQALLERAASYVNSFYKGIKSYPETEGPVIVVTMDCKGVPMVPEERSQGNVKPQKVRREKGDKRKGLRRDAVVTSHFTFEPEARTPGDLLKALMHSHTPEEKLKYKEEKKAKRAEGRNPGRQPINKQVHAAMDGKENAFARLADQVLLRNPSEDKKIIVLIDGASALKVRFQEEVKRRKWKGRIDAYILDIFHATEYLWEAGSALYGEKSPQRSVWVKEKLEDVLEGKVGYVIGALKQILTKEKRLLSKSAEKALHKVIVYFSNHKEMMNYKEYLAKGYPIGTGVIEGACGCLVKDRTDRSGMKWTHEGVQAILNLRAVQQNNDWDKYFSYYVDMETQKLYGSPTG